ncbi:MAG: 4Fe-4S dicluster domain-containing protein [Thermodesulfobacteriota bacterium]
MELFSIPLATLVYIALAVFAAGLALKVLSWFARRLGPEEHPVGVVKRVKAGIFGVWRSIFSRSFFTLCKAFFVDVIFQWKVLKESRTRWIMHMLLYLPFLFLIFFHALGKFLSAPIWGTDFADLNPVFFLRDICGVLSLAGLGIAVFRRYIKKPQRMVNRFGDHYAIVLVGVILLSGVLLIGVKIASHDVFMDMVTNYGGLNPDDDAEDVAALTAYWNVHYGLYAPEVKRPVDPAVLIQGRGVNESYCASCHVSTKYSPAGYVTAKVVGPALTALTSESGVNAIYWIHVLACLIGLALLPFTKMFHMLATPVSLFANAVMGKQSAPANVMTRRIMELDGCTHCGTCSLNCSAMMAFQVKGNKNILPSEKLAALKKLSWRMKLSANELAALSQGVYLCTNCDRCTAKCPAGLDLRDMWMWVREELLAREGVAEPLVQTQLSFFRGLRKPALNGRLSASAEKSMAKLQGNYARLMDKSATVPLTGDRPAEMDPTFAACFGCQNCTSVCPVVQGCEDPGKTLGLVPHQLMASVGMGLSEMASGAGMVWQCLTCYQCQEHCPQNVDVTDVIYGLKNLAAKKAG